jgi:SulP family sulfate permease
VIAILEAKRAGLLTRSQIVPNIVAGINVGVVALPLSLAFAIGAGAKPEQGLYTAIVAGIIVSLFGGSRVQIGGPTGAFIVVILGIQATYGYAGLQLAIAMAGLMLIAMGALHLGRALRFIPAPVIAGFTTGIGVLIWTGQWPAFFGLPTPSGLRLHQKLAENVPNLVDLHLATTALGLLGVAVMLVTPRIPVVRRAPAPILALLLVTLAQAAFGFAGVATVGSAFGGIPAGLPSLQTPELSLDMARTMVVPAATIALLSAIQALLSAAVGDGLARTKHDPNQELVAQGVANIASAMVGGIATTGAVARTATNVKNGGTNPISGIVHALSLLAILLFLTPLARDIPLAALASILFVISYNMCALPHFFRLVRGAPRADAVILLTTFGLTVFVDVIAGVMLGVLIATLQFLRRMADSVELYAEEGEDIERALERERGEVTGLPVGVKVTALAGPFFFAAGEVFQRALRGDDGPPRVLIVRLARTPFIDATGLLGMDNAAASLEARGVHVIFCEANERVRRKLDKARAVGLSGKAEYHDELAAAVESAGRWVTRHAGD